MNGNAWFPYKESPYVTRKEHLRIRISLFTFINPLETKLF